MAKKKDYRDELIEKYISTREAELRMNRLVFYALVFLGIIGLCFLAVIVYTGFRLDAINFFANWMR